MPYAIREEQSSSPDKEKPRPPGLPAGTDALESIVAEGQKESIKEALLFVYFSIYTGSGETSAVALSA